LETAQAINAPAGAEGRYAAGPEYRAWRGWSFADRKGLSPWLTFLVVRLLKRIGLGGGFYERG